MAYKKDYQTYVNLARKLITSYGKPLKVVCGLNINNDNDPFDPDEEKEVVYTTTGIIMPPVRGIYFQGTRYGLHTVTENDLMTDKLSCFLLPVYKENGEAVDLSKASHIIDEAIDNPNQEIRYKVYFCDVMRPTNKVIFFSYGVGR